MDIQKRLEARLQQRAVLAPLADATLAKVTEEQVGDADSFGRGVKYLGLVMPRTVTLQPDCTGYDTSFGDRCIPLPPAPGATAFNEADLGRLELPAQSARSLMCFTVTQFTIAEFNNPTPDAQQADLTLRVNIVIENAVLNDPTLIDPITGQPYGGRMSTRLPLTIESHTVAPFSSEFRFSPTTRSCVGGLVSKQALIAQGFTEKQATQFFKNPTTLRFGSSGFAASMSFLDFAYGIRMYGD